MIARGVQRLRRVVRKPLAIADAAANRLYTWRYNPLYQSGTLLVLSFLIMLVSGMKAMKTTPMRYIPVIA